MLLQQLQCTVTTCTSDLPALIELLLCLLYRNMTDSEIRALKDQDLLHVMLQSRKHQKVRCFVDQTDMRMSC